MRYPKRLVNKYGAKAGILRYVAKELPHIPQCKMVVKTPKQSIEYALELAQKAQISYPRLLRSSAVAELDGYEGIFPSLEVGGPDSYVMKRNYPNCGFDVRLQATRQEEMHYIDRISVSPKELKESKPQIHKNLPDSIAVIIAERSPSTIVGTYLKHPNVNDTFIMAINTVRSIQFDREHSAFTYSNKEGVKVLPRFGREDVERSPFISNETKKDLNNQLSLVASWHDQIADLALMDPNWTYQIEFGLDPVMLYQVRPFKRKEKADFTLEKSKEEPLVFGITPKEGLDVICERNIYDRCFLNETINPQNSPSLFYDQMRFAPMEEYLPNMQVSILETSTGLLSHSDIGAIRKSKVSAYYEHFCDFDLKQGQWYNVRSDGKSIQIKEISSH